MLSYEVDNNQYHRGGQEVRETNVRASILQEKKNFFLLLSTSVIIAK